MCGIAGIFSYHDAAPLVDRQELLRIREAMLARGPDGAGLWMSADERTGLAQTRYYRSQRCGSAAHGHGRRPLTHHLQRRDL